MKRFLSVGLLALGVVFASQRPAHAWINAKFSVGLNWSWQSANNSFLWGAWQSGPSHGGFIGGDYGYPGYGGGYLFDGGMATPSYYGAPAAPADPKKSSDGKDSKGMTGLFNTIPSWYGGNVYQSASWPGHTPAYYPNYNAGYYYYPSYAYPSYWYGW